MHGDRERPGGTDRQRSNRLTRRRVLAAAGVAASTGLAGCEVFGEGGEGGGDGGDGEDEDGEDGGEEGEEG